MAHQGAVETILYGCVPLALSQKFISVDNIIQALPTIVPEDDKVMLRVLVAYFYACIHKHPNEHYVDGVHILSTLKRPEFGAIYVLTGGDKDTCVSKEDQDQAIKIARETKKTVDRSGKPKVGQFLLDSLVRLTTDDDFNACVKIICNKEVSVIKVTFHHLIILARANRHYGQISPPQTYDQTKMFLDADHVDVVRSTKYEQRLGMVIERCRLLGEKAPLYWNKVARPIYQKLVNTLIALRLAGRVSDDRLLDLHQLIPDFFPSSFPDLSPVSRQILLLSQDTQAYVLGIPINEVTATPDLIHQALLHLTKSGTTDYCKELEKHYELSERKSLKLPFAEVNLKQRNTEDVLTESVFSYNPFDRLAFIQGDSVYYFIRHEFNGMILKKKNHWTSETLPFSIVHEMAARSERASVMELPDPAPLSELLEKVENGTLFHDDPEDDVNEDNDDNDQDQGDSEDHLQHQQHINPDLTDLMARMIQSMGRDSINSIGYMEMVHEHN